jgi:hypothetical protein
MAITDGLITRISPSAGDTDLVDIQSGGTLTGTGTKTLVDISGEKAWNLTSAALNMSFATRNIDAGGTTPVEGVSVAFRYRLNAMGTGTYDSLFGLKHTNDTQVVHVTKSGASNLRVRRTTNTLYTSPEIATTGTVHTVVLVYRPNYLSTSGDYVYTWRNQVGRVGDAADSTGVSFSGSVSDALDRLYIDTPNGVDIDILDAIYWDRQLTDAEAAAVADDLRAELPVGGGGTTVNATLGSVGVSAYTATIIAAQNTIVNATLGTVGVSAFDATVVNLASITTEPLKNNTGTVLASTGSIIATVYDLTTGALVVRKTGLTSDGSGVVTFSDAALVAATQYLVTITIATADGVARLTAE